MVYYCMILFVLLTRYANEVECAPAYMLFSSANEQTPKEHIHTDLTPDEMKKRKICWPTETCKYSRKKFDPYQYEPTDEFLASWCQCGKNYDCLFSHFNRAILHKIYRCKNVGGENSTTAG